MLFGRQFQTEHVADRLETAFDEEPLRGKRGIDDPPAFQLGDPDGVAEQPTANAVAAVVLVDDEGLDRESHLAGPNKAVGTDYAVVEFGNPDEFAVVRWADEMPRILVGVGRIDVDIAVA